VEDGEGMERQPEIIQLSEGATESTRSSCEPTEEKTEPGGQDDELDQHQLDETTNAPHPTTGGKTLPPKCEFYKPWELGLQLGDFAEHVECLIYHIKKEVMPAVRHILREEMIPDMVVEMEGQYNHSVQGQLLDAEAQAVPAEGQPSVERQDPAAKAPEQATTTETSTTSNHADEFLNRIFNPLTETAIPVLRNVLNERLPWLIESGLEEARLRKRGKHTPNTPEKQRHTLIVSKQRGRDLRVILWTTSGTTHLINKDIQHMTILSNDSMQEEITYSTLEVLVA
jgi:hypothetical protein